MVRFVRLCLGMLVRLFRGRQSLLLENLALRQQLVMLKRRHPRPSLGLVEHGQPLFEFAKYTCFEATSPPYNKR